MFEHFQEKTQDFIAELVRHNLRLNCRDDIAISKMALYNLYFGIKPAKNK